MTITEPAGRHASKDQSESRAAERGDQPKISVIINNYNYAPFISQALASAFGQETPPTEVIVVDDGSTDESRKILEAYRGTVRLVFQENSGQAAAINAGVHASRGEILCFLNSDDWWSPNKLASVAAAFDVDPAAVLVYHRLQPVDAEGAPILKPLPRSLCAGDLAPRLLRTAGWWPFPMTSSIAVRRSSWELAGDIPEALRISADAWLVGIYPFLGRVAALSASLGFYRIHSNNNWYSPVEDVDMLRRRMAHWETVVDATNRFLRDRGNAGRLNLEDHLPHKIAAAELAGATTAGRFRLGLAGLGFAGEPNLLRRSRDAIRTAFAARMVSAADVKESPP